MPIRVLRDNTYYIFDSQETALEWPGGARIAQIRLYALNTLASVEFQVLAGTPILKWTYTLHELGVGTSARTIAPGHETIDMGGAYFPTAWIPTTLTACTAWIDFI